MRGVMRSGILGLAKLLFILFIGGADWTQAQVSGNLPQPASPDNVLSLQNTVGLPPNASSEGNSEEINLANGALSMFLPVLNLPQRAGVAPLILGFTYDSNQIVLQQNVNVQPGFIDPGTGYVHGTSCDVYGGACVMFDDFTYTIAAAETNPGTTPLQLNLPRLSASTEWQGDVVIGGEDVDYKQQIFAGSQFCLTNFVFYDWSGAAHSFEYSDLGTAQGVTANCYYGNHGQNGNILPNPNPLVPRGSSSDSQFYRLDTSNLHDFTVTARDGTVYHFANPNIPCSSPGDCQIYGGSNLEQSLNENATSVVDRNGAIISISGLQITDTVGRVIQLTNDTNTGNQSISYKDSNGAQQTVSLTQGTGFEPITGVIGPDVGNWVRGNECVITASNPVIQGQYEYNLSYETQTAPPSGLGGPNGTGFTPYNLTFSGSQKSYHMLFDSFGHLMKVVYPSGGYHRYDYKTYSPPQASSSPISCGWNGIQVAHRYECRNATGSCTQEDTTTYGLQNSGSPVVVTAPDGSSTEHTFGYTFGGWLSGMPIETDTLIKSPQGTVLRKTHMDFDAQPYPPAGGATFVNYPFPTKVTTTYSDTPGTPSSYTSYSYDIAPSSSVYFGSAYSVAPDVDLHLPNPTLTDIYGFDSTHLKSVSQSWFHSNDVQNILNFPSSTTTTDPATATSNSVSYVYDTKGNVKSKSVSGTNIAALTTLYTPLDSWGRPTQITDPLLNVTTYSYADSWGDSTCAPSSDSGAYLTSVSNAYSQTTSYKYNSCTGTVASVEDVNSQFIGYRFDSLGRITDQCNPDAVGILWTGTTCPAGSGSIKVAYQDQPPLETSVTNVSSPDPSVTSSTIMDGLNRKFQSVRADGTTSETFYDTMGRVASVSNPHYATPSPTTDGTTYFGYDYLGRKISQTQQDSQKVWWCYNGSQSSSQPNCVGNQSTSTATGQWVDATDEFGNHSQQSSDALGRLIQVTEASPYSSPGTLGASTLYAYDGFGNLRTVTQNGQAGETARPQRVFIYDSLSRLITAYNPESGTVCYGQLSGGNCINGYDADSNLQYKTDARGKVIHYSYDHLNRLVAKSYTSSPGGSTTPSACYQYDQTTTTLGKGRLTSEWTQPGDCPSPVARPASGFLTSRTVLVYDPLGGVKSEQQCVAATCTANTPYALGYGYDLAGNPTSGNNGVGTISWQQAYDSAGRLATVTGVSAWTDPQFPSKLFGDTVYGAVGITGWTVGGAATGASAPALTFIKGYDTRLRVTSETVTGHQ